MTKKGHTFLASSMASTINVVVNPGFEANDLRPTFWRLNAGVPFQIAADCLVDSEREFLEHGVMEELCESREVGLKIISLRRPVRIQ